MTPITYNKQYIDNDDKLKVLHALGEEKITTGNQIIKFENNLKKYLGSKFISCVNSGTSAIDLAIKSLGLKKGDIVIMPSINFIASYNCAKNIGLKIYLTDVDPKSGQCRPEDVVSVIKKYNLKNVSLVISMYLGGQPDNVIEFFKLKKKYNFFLMEDACHALGGNYSYKNKKYKVGCSKHCDISTFSLHPLKTITAGEGGIISTNNKLIYKRVNLLRSHGILRKKKYWNYDVTLNGYNFRMSDINAALGNSQLRKIDTFIKDRRETAKKYINKLVGLKDYCHLLIIDKKKLNQSAWHLLIISINFKKLRTTKDNLIKFFLKKKIFLQVHYIPIYRFKVFKEKEKFKSLPGAEEYFRNSLSMPIFYKMRKSQIQFVYKALIDFIKKHNKNKSKNSV